MHWYNIIANWNWFLHYKYQQNFLSFSNCFFVSKNFFFNIIYYFVFPIYLHIAKDKTNFACVFYLENLNQSATTCFPLNLYFKILFFLPHLLQLTLTLQIKKHTGCLPVCFLVEVARVELASRKRIITPSTCDSLFCDFIRVFKQTKFNLTIWFYLEFWCIKIIRIHPT